jgi:hypothetical protein
MDDPDVPESGVTALNILLCADAQVVELAGRCMPFLVSHTFLTLP